MASRGNNVDGPKDVTRNGYDDELLSANWNPVIDLLEWSCARTTQEVARSAEQTLREEDADAFLGRIYTLGS